MTPDATPDRDALVPPAVTVTQTKDGLFEVSESGRVVLTVDSYEQAISDARTAYGEDVAIVLDAAPGAPEPVPANPPAPTPAPSGEPGIAVPTVPPGPGPDDGAPPTK